MDADPSPSKAMQLSGLLQIGTALPGTAELLPVNTHSALWSSLACSFLACCSRLRSSVLLMSVLSVSACSVPCTRSTATQPDPEKAS